MKHVHYFAFVVIAFLMLFYWFGIRPDAIRKDCYKAQQDLDSNSLTSDPERAILGNILEINREERAKTEYWYTSCLNEHGLDR